MTKTKKAVKQVNKQADKAIRKAKKEKFRAQIEAFLEAEYIAGIKNYRILVGAAIVCIIINELVNP